MSKLRAGVIGTGFGTSVHVPGLQHHPRVDVTALCSVRPGRAQEAATALGIPRGYDDYRRMLAAEPLDLVCIASAPYLHREMTLAALESGAHVICEKPTAMDAGEARAMLSAAEAAGRVHAIDHEFRYWPIRMKVKELVDEGYLGQVLQVSVSQVWDAYDRMAATPHGWLFESVTGGGFLGALGSHLVDSLRWWFGDITAAAAQLQIVTPTHPGPTGPVPTTADDAFTCLLQLANGASGLMQFLLARHGHGLRVEAFGTEGCLVLEQGPHGRHRLQRARRGEPLTEIPLPPIPTIAGSTLPTGSNPQIALFQILLDRVVARIEGRNAGDYATFGDGLAVQTVLDAIRRSHVERRWVHV